MENTYHELFASACQPMLLQKSFLPSKQQLQQAKMSLIHKHKVSNGIQQLLFCRQSGLEEDDLGTAGERKMVETEMKKYMDFVRKNYNQKVSEELTTVGKLRNKIKEQYAKNEAQRKRELDEKNGKNLAQQEVGKRRKMEEVRAGKKKVKTEQKPKSKKEGKGKQAKQGANQEEALQVPQPVERNQQAQRSQDELLSESMGLDLLNSLDEDDLDNYEDDE